MHTRPMPAASHAGCSALWASVLRWTGVVPVSDGNTQPSAVGGQATFHRLNTATSSGLSATRRLPDFVFGGP